MSAILGISAFYHDSAAALIVDGEIRAAAQEERYTRKKHDPGFPARAVQCCLQEAQLDASQLNYVAFYDKPLTKFDRLLETYLAYAPAGLRSFSLALPLWLKQKLHLRGTIREHLNGSRAPLLFMEHHESHAASAFFPSPFEEAAILTLPAWVNGAPPRMACRDGKHASVDAPDRVSALPGAQERDLLERFWRQSRGATLVGFNCLSFDLPVLLRRSLYLGVRAPMFSLNKYRPGSIVDLMQRLAYQGTLPYRSLAFYCTRFGIMVPDEVTGSDIGALVAAGEWSKVHDHVRADVAKTTALARRVGVLDREGMVPATGASDSLIAPDGTPPMPVGSSAPDLAFPKPFPQVLERQERRACQQARERRENTTVRQRSGGRCEVVLGERRCRKRGREVHHLVGGNGRRGRGKSVLATHEIHACADHHRLMQLRWIEVTWTTPQNPVATLRFAQVRRTQAR